MKSMVRPIIDFRLSLFSVCVILATLIWLCQKGPIAVNHAHALNGNGLVATPDTRAH